MPTTATAPERASIEAITLPHSVRERSSLPEFDYSDAFRIADAPDREPLAWARAMLTEASLARRAGLVTGWSLLGLRLSRPWSSEHVLGWPVRSADDHAVVLATESRLGLRANLMFERAPGGVVFATLVQLRGPVTPQLWRITEPVHVPIVRSLLLGAAQRV